MKYRDHLIRFGSKKTNDVRFEVCTAAYPSEVGAFIMERFKNGRPFPASIRAVGYLGAFSNFEEEYRRIGMSWRAYRRWREQKGLRRLNQNL